MSNKSFENLMIMCDCQDSIVYFQDIGFDDESWPDEVWIEFYTSGGKFPLRKRIKDAWNVLWGKNHALSGAVVRREQAQQIYEFFGKMLKI